MLTLAGQVVIEIASGYLGTYSRCNLCDHGDIPFAPGSRGQVHTCLESGGAPAQGTPPPSASAAIAKQQHADARISGSLSGFVPGWFEL